MKAIIPLFFLVLIGCSTTSDRKVVVEEVKNISNEDFKKDDPIKFDKSSDYYTVDDITSDNTSSFSDETVQDLPKAKLNRLEGGNDLLGRITSLCYQREFDDAFKTIDQGYFRYKNHPGYWTIVGNCYYQKRDFRKAALFYQKVIEIDKKYIPAYNNLGSIHLAQGEYEKALGAFKKAHEMSRFSKTPMYNLASLYLNFGVINESMRLFSGINKQRPGDPRVLNGLAVGSLFQGRIKRALSLYQKVPKSFFEKPEYGINYSLALYLGKRRREAENIIDDVELERGSKWNDYYSKVRNIVEGQ